MVPVWVFVTSAAVSPLMSYRKSVVRVPAYVSASRFGSVGLAAIKGWLGFADESFPSPSTYLATWPVAGSSEPK